MIMLDVNQSDILDSIPDDFSSKFDRNITIDSDRMIEDFPDKDIWQWYDTLIKLIFHNNPDDYYYQGFHCVASVVFKLYDHSIEWSYVVLNKLSSWYFRDSLTIPLYRGG